MPDTDASHSAGATDVRHDVLADMPEFVQLKAQFDAALNALFQQKMAELHRQPLHGDVAER